MKKILISFHHFLSKKQNLSKIIHFKVLKDDLKPNVKEKIHFFAMFFTL